MPSIALGSLAAETGCADDLLEDFGATFAAVAASRDESLVSTTGFAAADGVVGDAGDAGAADFATAFVASVRAAAFGAAPEEDFVGFGSALRTFGRRDGVPALNSRATAEAAMFFAAFTAAVLGSSFAARVLFRALLAVFGDADFESETLREVPRAEGAFAIDR